MTSPLRVRQLAAAIARFARALIGRNGSESGVDASGGADGANPNRNAIRAQRILRPIALRFGPRARHGNPPVPAGHVALGHAWRLLLVDGAEWGVALGTQDMHLQSSIAARLGPMLASGKIRRGRYRTSRRAHVVGPEGEPGDSRSGSWAVSGCKPKSPAPVTTSSCRCPRAASFAAPPSSRAVTWPSRSAPRNRRSATPPASRG